MPAASRTYWLTTACRIRRKDQSLVIERESGDKVYIPVTDVRDIVACASADLNTAVISLLNQHQINVHFLSHYGDYAGSLLTADNMASGEAVLGQVRLREDTQARMDIARSIVSAAAFNIRRVIDRGLLDRPFGVLEKSAITATTVSQLMGAEGTFRRSAWEVLDTKLPDWLRSSSPAPAWKVPPSGRSGSGGNDVLDRGLRHARRTKPENPPDMPPVPASRSTQRL